MLADGRRIEQSQIVEINRDLENLGVSSSVRTAIIRTLLDPPSEPRMTKIAPLVCVLFPSVKDSVVKSVARNKDVKEWTRDAEMALQVLCGEEIGDLTRRVVVQGVITEYLFNELHDQAAFKDWYQNSGLK